MPKSTPAKHHYAPGSSRGKPNRTTFRLQMADVARGEQIRALREQKKRESENGRLTQPTVADAVGVTLRAYQDWEASDEDNPKGISWENAKKLAKFFGVDAETLVRRPDEPEPGPWGEELKALRGQIDRLETTIAERDEKLDLILAHVEAIAAAQQLDEEPESTRQKVA